MWPLGVVLHPPPLDHDLRFLQRVEDLSIQALVPQFPVKAPAVAVLPRTARLDVQRPCAQSGQPLPQFLGHELRTVVRTKVLGDASIQHHVGQRLDDLILPQSPRYANRQSRVYSSSSTSSRRVLPSCVLALTKS